MKRSRNTTKIWAGSGNVYADLGIEDSERMLVKAKLTAAIAAIIAGRGLSQGTAAELLGLTQPKLSNILSGRFRGVSERRLMDCLTRLGRDVVIVIKDKPRSRGLGRVLVHESR